MQGFLLAALLFGSLAGCSGTSDPEGVPEVRGAWVQSRSITTPKQADAMLARVEEGHLNAVFVEVLAYGHAFYDSTLLTEHPDVALDYDPLAYVVEQAHQRGIAVHAWLVTGPMGYRGGPGLTFTEHPEWAMVGPDGRQTFSASSPGSD